MLAMHVDVVVHESLHEVVGTAEQFIVVGDEVDEPLEAVELLFRCHRDEIFLQVNKFWSKVRAFSPLFPYLCAQFF